MEHRATTARRGHLLVPIGLAVTSAAILAGVAAMNLSRHHAANAAPLAARLPSEADARHLLTTIGLDAEALAASGATATQAAAVVGAVREHLDEHWADLEAAQSAMAAAKRTYDDLERRVRQGVASSEERTSFAAAQSDLAAAEAQYQAALDAAFSAGTQSVLSQSQRTLLRTIGGNRSWELPVQYLASSRSEQDWIELRDAVDHCKAAQRFGEEVAAEAAQILLAADSASETVTALANLQAHRAAVASAWEAAVAE